MCLARLGAKLRNSRSGAVSTFLRPLRLLRVRGARKGSLVPPDTTRRCHLALMASRLSRCW